MTALLPFFVILAKRYSSSIFMVLIISDFVDNSTSLVVDWLIDRNVNYVILNRKCPVKIVYITCDSFCIASGDQVIKSEAITSYWHKNDEIRIEDIPFASSGDVHFDRYFQSHCQNSFSVLVSFILYVLQKKRGITSYIDRIANKIIVLQKAREFGLSVPNFLITTSEGAINDIFEPGDRLITKPISERFSFTTPSQSIKSYTEPLNKENLPPEFAPSFIQQYIIKKYEIRCFYIDGHFFSMAIFSQQGGESVDMKKNQADHRVVPYKLPQSVESGLHSLAKYLGLNSGSIDIIKGIDGNYHFLEFNQFGVFENLSHYCNYQIERRIAEYLINVPL